MAGMLIVIADDDRDGAESLADVLRLTLAEPVAIVLAFDGREAVTAVIGADPPDAVIMDIEMPAMDGFAAAKAMKAALGPAAPILIAASGHRERVQLAAESRVFDHALIKPVNLSNLLGLLASLPSRSSAGGQASPGASGIDGR
jgi:CheY-like chemotaxis protein